MKSRLFNLFTFFALLVSVVGSALTFTPAYAAGIVVNSNADTVANDGICTLREAITAANTNTASGAAIGECAAGAGADTITFAADYTITLVGSQLPVVSTQVTITGNGAAKTIIQANANPNTATYRVFELNSTGILTLDSLTVRHGRCNGTCNTVTDMGGGIFNNGALTITNSTVSNNSATNFGGGIFNLSTLTITNSTLSNNAATNDGGGMFHSGISATLTNVTFSANSAANGGGISSNSGGLTLTNVTFSGNSAASGGGMSTYSSSTLTNVTFSGNSATIRGGGMFNSGNPTLTNVTFSANSATSQGGGMFNNSSSTLTNVTFSGNSATDGGGMFNNSSSTLTNVTFSGNSATDGGGMYNTGSGSKLNNVTFSGNSATNNGGGMYNMANSFTLKNVIIANSTSGGDCFTAAGALLSAQNSLIEGGLTCVNGTNTNNLTGDPVLGALTNNGGSTQTFALLAGSPAINTGTNTGCPATDQRGVNRPQGAACDIGAYEFGPIIPVVTASNPSASAVLTSLSTINITFNQDMLNDSSAKAANNTVNYLLVERGTNGTFDTLSCNGGRVADDVAQNISTATYSNLVFMSTLTLTSPLAAGTYRLFICGTTSIWSVAGLELNNGTNDATVDFTVNSATTTTGSSTTTASSLPTTGFAPNKITSLPAQPADSAYATLGDLWLEIPSLNVKSSIVGVPQNANKTWDVNWLGNDTGWLNGTAFPTWNGNSVLTAHVTNADGLDGPFAALKNLKYGDQIIVHMGEAQYIYEIRSTKLARPYSTSFAFESLQDHSSLTLITCSGYNPINETYLFRRIVRAVLVEVK